MTAHLLTAAGAGCMTADLIGTPFPPRHQDQPIRSAVAPRPWALPGLAPFSGLSPSGLGVHPRRSQRPTGLAKGAVPHKQRYCGKLGAAFGIAGVAPQTQRCRPHKERGTT